MLGLRHPLARPGAVRAPRPLVAAPPRRVRARLRRLAAPQLVRARRRVPVRVPRAPDRHGARGAAPVLVVDARRRPSSWGSWRCSRSSRPYLIPGAGEAAAVGRRRRRTSSRRSRGCPRSRCAFRSWSRGRRRTPPPRASGRRGGSSSGTRCWSTSARTRSAVVLGHELGHHSANHLWKNIALVRALRASRARSLIALITRRRGGMREPLAVPLALLVFVVLQMLALPLQNAITRHMEAGGGLDRARDDPGCRRRSQPLPGLRRARPSSIPILPWWSYHLTETHPVDRRSRGDGRGVARPAGALAPVGRLISMARSVIVSAVRTPFGKLGGGLKDYEAPQLGAIAIRGGARPRRRPRRRGRVRDHGPGPPGRRRPGARPPGGRGRGAPEGGSERHDQQGVRLERARRRDRRPDDPRRRPRRDRRGRDGVDVERAVHPQAGALRLPARATGP